MQLVLITGASSGVGAATAERFVELGVKTVLVARSKDKIASLAQRLGHNAIPAPCDASDPDQVAQLVTTLEPYGTPDVVINCAGAGQWKSLPETSPTEARAMMDAPYFAAFNITRAFLPQMLARKSGVVIHVNSPACIAPWPASVGYSATRAALYGFHRALAQDLVGTGVHSCHVIFGKIASEYFANNEGVEERMPALARTLPVLSPDACADALLQIAQRPRGRAVFPRLLRAHIGFATLFPRLGAWALRF